MFSFYENDNHITQGNEENYHRGRSSSPGSTVPGAERGRESSRAQRADTTSPVLTRQDHSTSSGLREASIRTSGSPSTRGTDTPLGPSAGVSVPLVDGDPLVLVDASRSPDEVELMRRLSEPV